MALIQKLNLIYSQYNDHIQVINFLLFFFLFKVKFKLKFNSLLYERVGGWASSSSSSIDIKQSRFEVGHKVAFSSLQHSVIKLQNIHVTFYSQEFYDPGNIKHQSQLFFPREKKRGKIRSHPLLTNFKNIILIRCVLFFIIRAK
jgi:hypothetical protein